MSTKPKIQDAGEKLGGARKDLAQPTGTGETADQDNLLATLWPKPTHWTDLIPLVGAPRAALTMVTYENLAKTPHRQGFLGASADQWDHAYRHALTQVRELLSTPGDLDRDALLQEYDRRMEQYGQDDVGIPSLFKVWKYAIGPAARRSYRHPLSFTPIDDLRWRYLPSWGWGLDERVNNRLAVGALRLIKRATGAPLWVAVKGISGAWQQISETEFATEEEALELARPHVEALLAAKEDAAGTGKRRAPRNWIRPHAPEDMVRSGFVTPTSSGRTENDLLAAFGFRGIEFGNWVTQAQRQQFVDAFYDACSDLMQLLKMPPHFASLGGTLGVGYGSRGKGLSRIRAHFEPGILHFTKENGPGSFAHEFAHALDFYVADVLWSDIRATDNRGMDLPPDAANAWSPFFASEQMRWQRLPRAIQQSKLATALQQWSAPTRDKQVSPWRWVRDSHAMDAGRRSYWCQDSEMFARGFEAMVHNLLRMHGARNDMLVYGVGDQEGQELLDQGKDFPYPMGVERAVTCKRLTAVVGTFTAEFKTRAAQAKQQRTEQQLEFAL